MGIRIVVFDVLGTVLDERGSFRAAVDAEHPVGTDPVALADRWLDAVSETVARIARGHEQWKPWDRVIADRLAELAPLPIDRGGSDALSTIGHRLTPWPDSAAGLRRIHDRRDTVALSNAGVTALMDSSRTGDLTWSAVLSSEMVRSAKPDPRVYDFLLETLRVDPIEILFVAAHPWDLRAAATRGMRTAFVQRPTEGQPDADDRFDWSGTSLTGLAEALEHPDDPLFGWTGVRPTSANR